MRRSMITPRNRSSSTAGCPAWSTATTTPSPRCSSPVVPCSATANRQRRSAMNAPAASCAPGSRRPPPPRKANSPMSVEQQVASTDVNDAEVKEVVLGMWQALSDRNWEALTTYLSADCIYLDMPVGPIAPALGPEDH